MMAQPATGNSMVMSGTTGELEKWDTYPTVNPVTCPVPTTGWHFVILQYDTVNGNAYASIDLGAPILMTPTNLPGHFVNLLGKGVDFMPQCNHQIFDFRIFKPGRLLLETEFTYYYNDVLNSVAARTLPITVK
jgi:hypothetical protein